MQAFEMEDASGRYSSSGKGCFGRMSMCKKVGLVFFIFLATFFIGFGIGFGAGNVAPPMVYKYLQLPAPPPPSPWWMQPPPPTQAQWAVPAGYRRNQSVLLSSLSPGGTVGYMTFDSNSSRLFVGLLGDGLIVVNANNGTLNAGSAARVPGSVGCSGVFLAGSLGFCGSSFGFWQGSNLIPSPAGITVINLTSLSALRTVPVANNVGVNTGAWDSTNQQVLMTLVNGSIAVLSSVTGALLRTVNLLGPTDSCAKPGVACDPFGDVLVDPPSARAPNGLAYVAAPMMNSILQLDLVSLAVRQAFSLASSDCDIHGIAVDSVGRRLFVGCGNPFNPSVITLDADTGGQIGFGIKIGRGVYSVKYDKAREHVYAASGIAGNIAVIRASPGAPYNVREAVFTKAGARTLAFDPVSGTVYTAAPDGRFNPSTFVNEDLAGGVSFFPNEAYPNTVEVMAFRAP